MPDRWGPLFVNSALLLGAITLPNVAAEDDKGPIAVRNIAACAPIGPVASQYVGRRKLCRRARKEVLKSLRTGRDPEWDDVIRDSMPKEPKRLHQSPPSRRDLQHPKRHDTNPAAPPSASSATPRARSAGQPETRPSPGLPPPSAPAIPKTSQHVPTSHPRPSDRTPWPTPWVEAVALALLAAVVYLGKRRQSIIAGTTSLLSVLRGGRYPRTRTTPPTTTGTASSTLSIASVLAKGASLAGPGAEDAARHIAMKILSSRQGVPAELVLNRPDAWRLFGMDIGTLREDRIPGLILTDDHEQTRAFLALQTSSRRLLVTYGNEGEGLSRGRGYVLVVSISARNQGSTKISADGEVTRTADPSVTGRLPLLTRDEAFNRLMSMPTRARRCEEGTGVDEHAPHGL